MTLVLTSAQPRAETADLCDHGYLQRR
jgi:hypothetical protein